MQTVLRTVSQLKGWQTATLRALLLIPLTIGLGIAIGLALASPAGTMISSLLNTGAAITITLIDPLTGLLFWLFVSPLVVWLNLNIDLGAGIPDISLDRLTIALILVILLAETATGKRKLPRLTRPEKWMILTMLSMGFAVLAGGDLVADTQSFLDLYVMPFLVYFAVKNLIVNRRGLDRFLVTVIALGTYCAIYAIYTQLTGNVLFAEKDSGLANYTANLRIIRGLLGTPHAFGLVFSLTIPLNFYKLIAEKELWKKIVYTLTLMTLVLALFLTYKRGAWLGTMASFAIMQQFYPQFRRLFFVLLIFTLMLMWLSWDRVSESEVVTERATSNLETGNGRTGRWEEAIEIWKQKPIFGHGWDGFRRVSRRFDAVESTYLWILVSAGLAGLVSFIMVAIGVFREAITLGRQRGRWLFVDTELVAVFGGLFVAYLINISTVHMNSSTGVALAWAIAGAIIGSQSDGHNTARSCQNTYKT